MAKLIEIVDIINDKLKATVFNDKRFQKAAMFGIAKPMPYKKGDVFELIPTEVNHLGEGKKLVPDDKNPVQCYHKVNAIRNTLSKSQYGNGNDFIIRIAEMSMIVFALRNVIKMSEHDLDFNILASFPAKPTKEQISEMKLNDCTITYNSADFNSMAVYAREYNTKSYYLNTNHLFFEVKYTIECRLNKACINTCTTC